MLNKGMAFSGGEGDILGLSSDFFIALITSVFWNHTVYFGNNWSVEGYMANSPV